jgi:hypothetical protein
MAQSLPLLITSLGGSESARQEADALLGLYQNKVFCQNSCPTTNEWASRLIGRKRTRFRNVSVQHQPTSFGWFGSDRGISSGASEQFEAKLQSNVFAELATPTADNGWQAEAILYAGGHSFPTTRDSYIHTCFGRSQS